MIHFIRHIHSITDVIELQVLKESIKDQVTNPLLRWDERMVLYSKVQLINDRLTMLNTVTETMNL